MRAELSRGTLLLRVGPRFTVGEAEQIYEMLAMAPFSRVVLDFTGAREISSAALVAAAAALATLKGADVEVNGLADAGARMPQ